MGRAEKGLRVSRAIYDTNGLKMRPVVMHFLTGSRMVKFVRALPPLLGYKPHSFTRSAALGVSAMDFPVFVILFSPCAPTDKHHDTVQCDTDPERPRRGVGLLLAGTDWRSILSERAQWVRYP
jgi:hypothetical protein